MIDNEQLKNMRKEYSNNELSKKSVKENPVEQFGIWFNEAVESKITEPNAMALSTVSHDLIPSSRIVLLKSFNDEGFIFFTNYESEKGKEIDFNNNVALLFFWAELERQVRITGKAEKISKEESEEYFFTRPLKSRIGAWASHQSSVIENRNVIIKEFMKLSAEFALRRKIPLPEFWGGYRVYPSKFEFWQGRESRLHDRIRYTKVDQDWKIERLSP